MDTNTPSPLPTVGRIVHYYERKFSGQWVGPWAAIVSYIPFVAGEVHLYAFPPDRRAHPLMDVPYYGGPTCSLPTADLPKNVRRSGSFWCYP